MIQQQVRFRSASSRSFRPVLECLEDRCVPATLLSGFTESLVADNLSSPTAMEFSPDGDLWVIQQGGVVKRFGPGDTTADVVGKLAGLGLDANGERGLLGIAFDPDYASTKHVFLYYTATSPNTHNRISVFTVDTSDPADFYFLGTDTSGADAGSSGTPDQDVILDLNPLSGATNHNGGAIHFGPDEKLYVAVGENANPSNSQTLDNLLGKMLRLNTDGSIPDDNPFGPSAIWALGLRNPFTFAFQPGTGRMFINDVGQNAFEEINNGVAGSNYGWPSREGITGNPPSGPGTPRDPFYFYNHGGGTFDGFAITGGAFYDPTTQTFPQSYAGDYFFADFVNSWINVIDLQTKAVRRFAGNAGNPVDLRVADDGSLYYLSIGDGTVHRVRFTDNQEPNVTDPADDLTVAEGQDAAFSVAASGANLTYQWQRLLGSTWSDLSNGGGFSGVNTTTLTIANAQSDDAGPYRVVVSNSFGTDTSRATLSVTPNQAPTGNITIGAGLTNGKFIAGQEITFSSSANDPEDGPLGPEAFTWEVKYVTSIKSGNPALRPFVPEFSDQPGGTFTPATTGPYTKTDVVYRILLTLTDSEGLTRAMTRDIAPKIAILTVDTQPVGLLVTIGGQPFSVSRTFKSVVGFEHSLGAVSQQFRNRLYDFVSWSDGGAATHTTATPLNNTTYTATFAPAFVAKINFQTATSPGFPGFQADVGEVFGQRGNGSRYGWNADNSANVRDRNSALSPDERFDTTIGMQGADNRDASWEIEVPNGTYRVRLVAGDAAFTESVFRTNVEDILAIDGVQTSSTRWFDNEVTVTVTDGKLTISNADSAVKNKLCFVRLVLMARED